MYLCQPLLNLGASAQLGRVAKLASIVDVHEIKFRSLVLNEVPQVTKAFRHPEVIGFIQ